MAKTAAKGIPLWDYIKRLPEPFVRGQLDRGELRYTWIDVNNNARASDDGGELPPKGWWPRPEFTWIDEHSFVRGHALFGPVFPMFSVRVFPAAAPADTPPEPKARKSPTKRDVLLEILAGFDKPEGGGLKPDLEPAQIERKVSFKFCTRWAELRPDDQPKLGRNGKPKPPVSRREIYRAYHAYLETRPAK